VINRVCAEILWRNYFVRAPTCESDHGTAQILETRAGSFPGTLPTFQLQQLDNQKGCLKAKWRNNKKKTPTLKWNL